MVDKHMVSIKALKRCVAAVSIMLRRSRRRLVHFGRLTSMDSLSFLIILICVSWLTPAMAWQGMPVPKLHVSGNKLVDGYGRIVVLHGTHQPTDPYFAGDGKYFNSPTDYANALRYFNAVVDTLTDTSPHYGFDHGWYVNYVRFAPDKYWFGDTSDGSFDMQKLKSFTTNVLVPYILHCRSRGVYVVIMPNIDKPDNTTVPQLQTFLKTIWGYWVTVPQIKSAGNVQFELMNEPINALASDNTWGSGQPKYWQALTNWLQPIVDTIRNSGADNIIWVPGLSYQGEYQGFVQYPISGGKLGNIGYAAHLYPAYGGVGDDPNAMQNHWNSNYQPCVNIAPMLITEMSWFRFRQGDNDYWHLFDGVTGDDTSGFGTAMRHVADANNVGWTIATQGSLLAGGPNTDMADPAGGLNYDPSRDSCALAGFNWWYQYRGLGPTVSTAISAYDHIEAERCDTTSGSIRLEVCQEGTQNLGYIAPGDYTVYKNVSFGSGATRFIARIAGFGGHIQVRTDSPTGTLAGDLVIPSTGGWQNWQTFTFNILPIYQIHNLYLVFQPSINLHWFTFGAVNSNVTLATHNGGFELPALGPGNFAYGPAGSGWSFSGIGANSGAGLTANNSGFTSANPNASEGQQSAFVQSVGAMSEQIAGPAYPGTWTITFLAAERKLRSGFGQTLSVLLDGKQIGLATPITLGYDLFTFKASVAAGNHVLKLQGMSETDDTAFVDDIKIEVTPPPAPPAPQSLIATAQDKQVSLTWTASTWAKYYNVYMGTVAGAENTVPVKSRVAVTSTSLTGLVNGTKYYFTVRAVNASGGSGPSNEVLATPKPLMTARATSRLAEK